MKRNFIWQENLLEFKDLPPHKENYIYLALKDTIVPVHKIYNYFLKCQKKFGQREGVPRVTLRWADLHHAGFLVSEQDQKEISSLIHSFYQIT